MGRVSGRSKRPGVSDEGGNLMITQINIRRRPVVKEIRTTEIDNPPMKAGTKEGA